MNPSGPLEPGADTPLPSVLSWAFAINSTVDSSDIVITLLSLIVVGKLARVTGLVAIRSRPNVRLATVPELSLAIVDGPPLVPLSAHLLPHADMAWVSWLFKRPEHALNEYEGRIGRVDLVQHTSGGLPGHASPSLGRGSSGSRCRRPGVIEDARRARRLTSRFPGATRQSPRRSLAGIVSRAVRAPHDETMVSPRADVRP